MNLQISIYFEKDEQIHWENDGNTNKILELIQFPSFQFFFFF